MQKTPLIIFLLLMLVSTAGNTQHFNLITDRTFTDSEPVQLQLSTRYGSFAEQNPVFNVLIYRSANAGQALTALGQYNGRSVTVSDSMLQQFELIKNFKTGFVKDQERRWYHQLEAGQLDPGVYVVEVFYGFQQARVPVIVSSYDMVMAITGTEIASYVASQQSGKAEKGFTFHYVAKDTVLKATTNQQGLAVLDYSPLQQLNNYMNIPVFAVRGEDIAVSQWYYSIWNYNSDNLAGYLFTSRSAYRPGQTVYFKGYVRQRYGFDLQIARDTIAYTVTDSKGKQVLKGKALPDEWGSFSDSLQTTPEMPLGTFNITVEPEKNGQEGWPGAGRLKTTFELLEYKKPEFEVKVNTGKGQYTSGDTIRAIVKADYFFGEKVENAKVSWRVLRKKYYQQPAGYWWWFGHYQRQEPREAVLQGEGELSGGEFSFEVPTLADTENHYTYTLTAEVQDASLRTVSGAASVVAAYADFSLASRSEKYYYQTGDKLVVRATAKDFTGKPVAATLSASLVTWNSGFRGKKFQETEVATDPATGEAVVTFNSMGSGSFQAIFEATDAAGRKITSATSIYVVQEGQSYYSWWNTGSGGIRIMPEQRMYVSGETVKAMIYLPESADAFVSLSGEAFIGHHIKNFESRAGAPKDKGAFQEVVFDIPENAFGELKLLVAYTRNGKLYQQTETVQAVPQQQFLNVALSFDSKEYRPGNVATATVEVTDYAGRPVPHASVTLSTADEAIYSLYPDKTGDITQAFYGSEKKPPYLQVAGSKVRFSTKSELLYPEQWAKRQRQAGVTVGRDFYLPRGQWHRIALLDPESHKGAISGFVIDYKTGQPLEGIKVKTSSGKTSTDRQGFYQITNTSKADSTISFSHKRSTTRVGNAPANDDLHLLLNVALEENHKKKVTIAREEWAYSNRFVHRLANSNASWGATDDEMVMEEAMPGQMDNLAAMSATAAAKSGEGFAPVTIRQDFKDAIYWAPSVTTNTRGQASVTIRLPDNLTTWRTVAKVATADTKVGQTLAKIVTRKDLLVRMETPRFITAGDELMIVTNVHNYLSRPQRVRVSLQANGVTVEGTSRTISIPAGGEQRVNWPVDSRRPGMATFTVKAEGQDESDGKQLQVPVLPHGLKMVAARNAVVRDTGKESVSFNIPEDVDMKTVKLQISAVPSVSAALLNSLDDLIGYPYGCVEQTMSRFLPTLIVASTLRELGGELAAAPDTAEIRKMVAKGVARLQELQHDDGGWGWWKNDQTHPFMTAYVVYGLHLARENGYNMPENLLGGGKRALMRIMPRMAKESPVTFAYAQMVAAEASMEASYSEPRADSLENAYEVALWLQAAVLRKQGSLATAMAEKLEQLATKEGSFTFWGGERFYYSWRNDQVETTAHAVKALSMYQADHPMLGGAVQWLMSKRRGDSWHNTRQTAMTVFGLLEVIKQELSPGAEMEIYANNRLVARKNVTREDVFGKGFNFTLLPEDYLVSASGNSPDLSLSVLKRGENNIEVRQKGKGTTYLSAKLHWFLNGTEESYQQLKAEEQPFEVERTWYKLVSDKAPNGKITWYKKPVAESQIRSGDNLLVEARIKVANPQEYVLVEDPKPAGFEFIENRDSFVIDGEEDRHADDPWGTFWGNWYTHEEYRDTHYALTITSLREGEYEYSYLLKAQVPGQFKANPAVVQLMYYPEVRGFSEFSQLEIANRE